MNEPIITFTGRAGADPDLRFTESGNAWVTLRVAVSPRVLKDNEWVDDGPTMWFTVKAFKTRAEATIEAIRKGSAITVTGRLKQEAWKAQNGEERISQVVMADHIGVDVMQWRKPPAQREAAQQAPQQAPQYAAATTQRQQPEPPPF